MFHRRTCRPRSEASWSIILRGGVLDIAREVAIGFLKMRFKNYINIDTSILTSISYQRSQEATGPHTNRLDLERRGAGHVGRHPLERLATAGDHRLVGGIGDRGRHASRLRGVEGRVGKVRGGRRVVTSEVVGDRWTSSRSIYTPSRRPILGAYLSHAQRGGRHDSFFEDYSVPQHSRIRCNHAITDRSHRERIDWGPSTFQ